MRKLFGSWLAALTLAGCASIPDVEFRYFPARASSSVTVTQTIDCSPDKKQLNIVHTPTVVTNYSSDRSRKPFVLRTKDLQSSLADADIKVDWFDDGRLKSINQSSTGQGESIVKAAMTFLAPVVGGAASAAAGECDEVAKFGGAKAVTIVYEGTVTYASGKSGETVRLQANLNSKANYDSMQNLLKKFSLPVLEFKVSPWQQVEPLVEAASDASNSERTVLLTLSKTAVAPVEILVSKTAFWSSKIIVPTTDTYTLPIPKPALFGKQGFALTLNEAGGITTNGYNNLSGTAGAFNALNAISTTVSPSESTKAAAIKAEADVIAQTQRLAACQAKPADCK